MLQKKDAWKNIFSEGSVQSQQTVKKNSKYWSIKDYSAQSFDDVEVFVKTLDQVEKTAKVKINDRIYNYPADGVLWMSDTMIEKDSLLDQFLNELPTVSTFFFIHLQLSDHLLTLCISFPLIVVKTQHE